MLKNHGPGGCCCDESNCESDRLYLIGENGWVGSGFDWSVSSPSATFPFPILRVQRIGTIAPRQVMMTFTAEATAENPILFVGLNSGDGIVISFEHQAAWPVDYNALGMAKENQSFDIGAGPYEVECEFFKTTYAPGDRDFGAFYMITVNGVRIATIPTQFDVLTWQIWAMPFVYGFEAWSCNEPYKPVEATGGFENINYQILGLPDDTNGVPKEQMDWTGTARCYDFSLRLHKEDDPQCPIFRLPITWSLDAGLNNGQGQYKKLRIEDAACAEMNGTWGESFVPVHLTSASTQNGYTFVQFRDLQLEPYSIVKEFGAPVESYSMAHSGWTVKFTFYLQGSSNSGYYDLWLFGDESPDYTLGNAAGEYNLVPSQIFAHQPIVSGGFGPIPTDPQGCDGLQYASRYATFTALLGENAILTLTT